MSARAAALWAAFLAVLALKCLWISDLGTNDMNVALGWGHDLLARGLVKGYSGSNFPIAFQFYELLVTVADHLGINEFAAMKGFDILCDLAIFVMLRAYLRRLGLSPDWAFLYWISPYFLAFQWLGYDHFQMGVLVMATLLAIQRADSTRGWLLASVPLGIGFLQRPQVQGLLVVLALYLVFVALERWREDRDLRAAILNERTKPALLLFTVPALLFFVYTLWFWIGGKDALFLTRSYATLSAFSPAFSANMLNVWQMVAEFYRHGDQQLSTVSHPGYWHSVAAVVGFVTLTGGSWLIVRTSARRPIGHTFLLLFAFASIALPNVYTRAHDNHFFLGALLAVPVIALLGTHGRRLAASGVLAASLALQGFNCWAIYGFGSVRESATPTAVDVRSLWTWDVRFAAAGVNALLFVALLVALWPLARRAAAGGDDVANATTPAA